MVRAVSTCSHYTCCRTLPFMLTRTPIDVPQIVRIPLQLTPSTSVNPDGNNEISTTILSLSHATCCMLYGYVTSQHGCHEQHRSCTCTHHVHSSVVIDERDEAHPVGRAKKRRG